MVYQGAQRAGCLRLRFSCGLPQVLEAREAAEQRKQAHEEERRRKEEKMRRTARWVQIHSQRIAKHTGCRWEEDRMARTASAACALLLACGSQPFQREPEAKKEPVADDDGYG